MSRVDFFSLPRPLHSSFLPYSSSIGWLVLDIMTARKNHMPPFISVDCAWGYDYNAGRITKGNGGMPKDTSFLPCIKDGKQDPNCHC